jgi:protein ImuB
MLDLDPDVRDFLASLGILTVGDFLTLPPAATRVRLGEAAFRLHQLASGDLWRPLVPAAADPIFTRQVDLDAPIGDVDRLVFLAKPLVDGLVADLASRSLAAVRLTCRLTLDNRRSQDVAIAPAAPTIDAVQLVTLLRLRLSATALSARVTALEIGVAPTAALPATLRLFAAHSRRDLSAAARAFARLRALLGEDAIVRARLVEAHLPRARVAWEAVDRLPDRAPAPRGTAPRRLVRRLLAASERLSTTVETGARDWLRGEIDDGRVSAMAGPYVVSGAWWRGGVHREYFFLRSSTGAIRWVYFDRAARAWFLEGRVE